MMRSLLFESKEKRQEFIDRIRTRYPNKTFTNVEHDGKFYTSFQVIEAPFAGLEKLIGKRRQKEYL